MLQKNLNFWERVPKSALIKINVNISPELILEINTTSAEADENMLSSKHISCMSKICPYGKRKTKKTENKSKQAIKIESTAQS